jgi:hypothetical protein
VPNAPALTTRQIIALISDELGSPIKVSVAPRLLLRAIGLFNKTVHEVDEMLYEFTQPFVVASAALPSPPHLRNCRPLIPLVLEERALVQCGRSVRRAVTEGVDPHLKVSRPCEQQNLRSLGGSCPGTHASTLSAERSEVPEDE